jgi:hypothetical protein
MKKLAFVSAIIAYVSSGMAESMDDDANLPPRPIGQAVVGAVLCGLSIPHLIIGAASMNVGTQDPRCNSGNYGLAKFPGIAGYAEGISGIILLTSASIRWQIRTRMERARNRNLSLSTGLLATGRL